MLGGRALANSRSQTISVTCSMVMHGRMTSRRRCAAIMTRKGSNFDQSRIQTTALCVLSTTPRREAPQRGNSRLPRWSEDPKPASARHRTGYPGRWPGSWQPESDFLLVVNDARGCRSKVSTQHEGSREGNRAAVVDS